jgi:Xaa-Pro aminopeptidase
VNRTFAGRRERVLAALGADGALVLSAAPELFVGADTDVRYVPSADLYYLTGYTEPGAVLVLCPSADEPFTMFVRPRDPDSELWTGARGGVEAARDVFGADAAHPLVDLLEKLPRLLAGASRVFTVLDSGRADVDAALRAALAHARRSRPRSGLGIHTITEPHVLLAPMRLRKDASEIAAMRAAADITVQAFEETARGLNALQHEHEVEAAVEYGFRRRRATAAFPTIAAGGRNATVLHYTASAAPLRAGDLLLLDAGARADMYCADITRTFPLGGRFTPEQRAVYDVVLAAHDAVIACIAPGRSVAELDEVALRTLVQGMIDLRLLDGSIDELIEKREYRRYFPHRVSHWLGLDVHDAGDYQTGSEPVTLEPGMVLTVEPGLYITAGKAAGAGALDGIGVRLEDDVLVTDSGSDVLTSGLPIRPGEVESLVGG